MKSSIVGEQKKKTKKTRAQTRTRTHTHAEPEEIKKKGRQTEAKHKKKTRFKSMFSCSSSQSYSLVHSQSSLSVSLPQYSISFPLHLTPSFYSSVFHPSLSFITMMKKQAGGGGAGCSEDIPRGHTRVGRGRCREMKRDEERRRRKCVMFPLQCQQTRSSSSVKKL